MNKFRTLTIILNLIIMIGRGHGAGPLAIFEALALNDLASGDFHFNISGSYDDKIMTVALLSFFGQCVLIASFFIGNAIKSKVTLFGCSILVAAMCLLTIRSFDVFRLGIFSLFSLELFSLFTAGPFIWACVVLVKGEIKVLRQP